MRIKPTISEVKGNSAKLYVQVVFIVASIVSKHEIDFSYDDVKGGLEMLPEIRLALEKCRANHI